MKGHTRRIRNALSEKGYIEEWGSCFTAFRIIFVEESNDMKKKFVQTSTGKIDLKVISKLFEIIFDLSLTAGSLVSSPITQD